ncbi:hypothetical protein QVD17_27803 [Tagetes erecta]|uniref:BAG domain-containing protein n=1 Tax=Tagetes erecta TaxID=13708 RepID=A0AAD8KBP6_TARER|nr:hypothetical protein QVD17_27803 [Tagetes erecta]
MDLSSPKPMFQPWLYGGSYSYPVPHQYHGCCNHSCYGGGAYGFWPPYTHYPPPPAPLHPHGLMYAPYPGAYPAAAAYSVPPQHYSVEQPRYEYDKNNHAPHHCCGCNHEKRPEIKDEAPVEKDASETLVPLLLKDHPEYPIMWLPMSNNESKAKEKEKSSRDLEPVKQIGNGEMAQNEQGGGNRFPFKIVWLPSKNDEVGKDTKENNLDQVANKGLEEKMTKKNEGERETNSKHVVQKVVPVKQASTNKEETSCKHAVQKVIPVKQVSANEETKNRKSAEAVVDSVEKTDNGSKASPKTPKLPPVCLRIDPLPRKKKSSRSPSPGQKGRSNESPVNSPKSSQVLKKNKEEQDEGEIKTDDHANKGERDNVACHGDVPKGKVEEKKNLSEHEAALIIQSVYRGFEVRKSQPLKKLRQIYEVKKQVFELRNDIQDLESSYSTANIDGKKKLIIGETIMSLLLKLDTIQGLHPFVREVRKSVAKELVGLQEKLDSLASAKSETPSEGRPQAVMHPEGDANQEKFDQAQACTGLSENHENTDTEPQYDDDEEACHTHNPERQSDKSAEDDAITDLSHQTTTESDTVQDTESQQGGNSIGDLQLGLQNEKLDQAPTERDEALGLCESQVVEAKESQEDANTGELQLGLVEEKLDQAPTERDEALGLCENRKVESIESEEGCNATGEPQLELDKEKFDQTPSESDEAQGSCENHEEGYNTIEEPKLESHKEELDQASTEAHKEELDQAPTEALGLCHHHEAEAIESQEGCNTVNEPQLESHNEELCHAPTEAHKEELDQAPTEVHKEVLDQAPTEAHKEVLDQAPTEAYKKVLDQAPTEALGVCENHEAEAMESEEVFNTANEPQLESHKEALDQEPTVVQGSHENHEVETTESQEGCNAIGEPQTESYKVELDQAPTKYDSINKGLELCDSEACQQRHEAETAESCNSSGTETCDNNLVVSGNVQMDDGNMMEIKSELAEEDAAKEIQDAKAKDVEGSSGGLVEENEKLRVAVEELMKAGKEQLGVIRELTGRVKDLEKKLSKKKKVKVNNKCSSRRPRGCVVQKAS